MINKMKSIYAIKRKESFDEKNQNGNINRDQTETDNKNDITIIGDAMNNSIITNEGENKINDKNYNNKNKNDESH